MPKLILLAIVVITMAFAGCFQTEHPGPLRVRVENITYSSPTNLTLILAFDNTGTHNITRADFYLVESACSFEDGSSACESGYVRFPAAFDFGEYDRRAILNDTDVIPPGGTWLATLGVEFGPVVLSRTGYYSIYTYGQYTHNAEVWKGHFSLPCYDGELAIVRADDLCGTSR